LLRLLTFDLLTHNLWCGEIPREQWTKSHWKSISYCQSSWSDQFSLFKTHCTCKLNRLCKKPNVFAWIVSVSVQFSGWTRICSPLIPWTICLEPKSNSSGKEHLFIACFCPSLCFLCWLFPLYVWNSSNVCCNFQAVDQFFNLNLPMDIIHLRSLLIGIFRCLDAYLLHVVNHQGFFPQTCRWNARTFFPFQAGNLLSNHGVSVNNSWLLLSNVNLVFNDF